ncbi:MAG: hypothetical protein CBC55_03730 [Gammaproteobacteria bacterium TMED95]|nr:MAG: hypothetical protein CBC55_03730 [Gammaproteobacteria bacterium TMED95]
MIRILCFLVFLIPFGAFSQDDTVELSADIQHIKCREKLMSIDGGDVDTLRNNDVIDACQGFPLSDDVAAQVLGALIGPDMVGVFDVLSSFTGEAHGFNEDDNVFLLLKPLHTTLLYFNLLVFGVFILLTSTHIALQVIRWKRGDINLTPKSYIEKYGMSAAIKGLLSYPFLGWLNPLQFLGLLFVIAFLWISKIVIVYLFLASFFSNTGSVIKDSVENSLKVDVGNSIVNYVCDIEQRESLINSIQQNSEGGADMSYVRESNLYKCLSGDDVDYPGMVITPTGALDSTVTTYRVTPKAMAQTQFCVAKYREDLESWGTDVDDYAPCGASYISMPVGATEAQILNASNVYMSEQVEKEKREIALIMREKQCRDQIRPDFNSGPVEKCFVSSVDGDSYQYDLATDPLSGTEKLAYHSLPLSSESNALLKAEAVMGKERISEAIGSNIEALKLHFSDILSLINTDSLSDADKQLLSEVQDDVNNMSSEDDESSLGVSQTDIDNVIMSMRRGMWSVGTLFFGDITESLEDKQLIKMLSQVLVVESAYGKLDEYRKLYSLIDMLPQGGQGIVNNAVKGNIGYGVIIPRLGLYIDSIECWHDQIACEAPALNPFTELSKRGVEIIEHASFGTIVTKTARYMMQGIAKVKMEAAGYSIGEVKNTRLGKYMVFDTFEEIYLLYLFIGFVLVVVIPGMPLVKITVVLVSWIYDVLKELLVVTISVVTSSHSHIDEGFISDEVKDAFKKIFGLGLYFLFIVVGVLVMFVMFSFLYALNVLVVGALNFVVEWSVTMTSLESMVMGVVMDSVIVGLLVYEVRICTPYIDKLPKELASYFNLHTSDTDGIVKQAENAITSNAFAKISHVVHRAFN